MAPGIEVAVRVDIAHRLGERDIFAYRDFKQFHPGFAGKKRKNSNKTAHQEWLNKYEVLVNRSKEDFMETVRNRSIYEMMRKGGMVTANFNTSKALDDRLRAILASGVREEGKQSGIRPGGVLSQ